MDRQQVELCGSMWQVLCFLCCIALAAAALVVPQPDVETTPGWEVDSEETSSAPELNLDDFYDYEGMMRYLRNLTDADCCLVNYQTLAYTSEQRAVVQVTISEEQETAHKKVIIVDAATHGNEWITTTVALKIINELVVNSVENVQLLHAYDWYILPMVNPDGYEYSMREKLKLWKKNRSTNGGQYGTNLNRNYDTHWNATQPPAPSQSQDYAGSKAFSEPETEAIGSLMRRLVATDRQFLYISLHTENKSIFYPSVYDSKPTPSDGLLHAIAQFASAAIYERTGSVYVPGLAHGYHGVGGTSLDYAYDIGIPLPFSFELPETRPEAENKTTFIYNQANEGWQGVKQLALGALEKYGNATANNNSSITTTSSPAANYTSTTSAPATNDASRCVLASWSLAALLACLCAAAMIK